MSELLGYFKRYGVTVGTVVIICDGCVEGGNYECCTGDGFMGRLLPIVSESFEFYFDHLCERRGRSLDLPLEREPIEPLPIYLKPLIAASHPLGEVKGLRFRKMGGWPVAQGKIGQTEVRVIRDSMWNHDLEEDWLFLYAHRNARHCLDNYLRALADVAQRVSFIRGSAGFFEALELARQRRAQRIGFIPFKGGYQKILDELEKLSDPPLRITFYHLNSGDFQPIYRRLAEASDRRG